MKRFLISFSGILHGSWDHYPMMEPWMKPMKSQFQSAVFYQQKAFVDADHVCDGCGKSYIHSRHLSRHKKYECGKPPRFKCFYCNHRTKHKNDVKKHVMRCHKNEAVKFCVVSEEIWFFFALRFVPQFRRFSSFFDLFI